MGNCGSAEQDKKKGGIYAHGMKGRISEKGYLHIDKGGKEVTAKCVSSEHRDCGDWCQFFGEPVSTGEVIYGFGPVQRPVTLKLCQRVVRFTNFSDERGKEKEEDKKEVLMITGGEPLDRVFTDMASIGEPKVSVSNGR